MALSLGGGSWGLGNKKYNPATGQYEGGGTVWNGPGPAPSGGPSLAEMQQMMASSGTGGTLAQGPTGNIGLARNTGQNGAQLSLGGSGIPGGAVSPAVQPGATQFGQQPGGMTSQQLQSWIDASPENAAAFNAKYTASQQIPAGTSGFTTSNPTQQPNTPQYGLMGAEDALQRGLTGSIAGLEAGVNQASQTLSPYTQGGSSAFNLQANLSGANGPEAQRQAFENYNQSPEMAYALKQAEKALTRNAAATGGLGGGNVLQALQENAIGMAQQDYGNAFNRLGSLSSMGQNSANLLGGIQANAGSQAGQFAYGTGQSLASGRTRAGEQIAGNIEGTSQNLANMINQQGNDLSSIIGTGGGNLANLLSSYGIQDSQQLRDLAALLGNIRSGSASTVAGTTGLPSVSDPGILGGLGSLAGGIGGLLTGMNT